MLSPHTKIQTIRHILHLLEWLYHIQKVGCHIRSKTSLSHPKSSSLHHKIYQFEDQQFIKLKSSNLSHWKSSNLSDSKAVIYHIENQQSLTSKISNPSHRKSAIYYIKNQQSIALRAIFIASLKQLHTLQRCIISEQVHYHKTGLNDQIHPKQRFST
jgi:hypothetical protein